MKRIAPLFFLLACIANVGFAQTPPTEAKIGIFFDSDASSSATCAGAVGQATELYVVAFDLGPGMTSFEFAIAGAAEANLALGVVELLVPGQIETLEPWHFSFVLDGCESGSVLPLVRLTTYSLGSMDTETTLCMSGVSGANATFVACDGESFEFGLATDPLLMAPPGCALLRPDYWCCPVTIHGLLLPSVMGDPSSDRVTMPLPYDRVSTLGKTLCEIYSYYGVRGTLHFDSGALDFVGLTLADGAPPSWVVTANTLTPGEVTFEARDPSSFEAEGSAPLADLDRAPLLNFEFEVLNLRGSEIRLENAGVCRLGYLWDGEPPCSYTDAQVESGHIHFFVRSHIESFGTIKAMFEGGG